MVSKNTICLCYDGTALDAAQFYADTFPDRLDAEHRGYLTPEQARGIYYGRDAKRQ